MKKSFAICLTCMFLFNGCALRMTSEPDKTGNLPNHTSKIEVMTLGTFHFHFPNLDAIQIDTGDQIDVLESKHQKEIEMITDKISGFKPTLIVIERQPSEQRLTDSAFNEYMLGNYKLKRNEGEQIGFRLAKKMGIKKLHCVDEWGVFNEKINNIISGLDTIEAKKFENYFYGNPDSAKRFIPEPVYKSKGILAALREANEDIRIKKDFGNYLIGLFKYESVPFDFTGVDFETGRWFNRNLRIFRNIQRIEARSSDRILVIYGAGHLNLLNYFFECSPEYTLVPANKYLK